MFRYRWVRCVYIYMCMHLCIYAFVTLNQIVKKYLIIVKAAYTQLTFGL